MQTLGEDEDAAEDAVQNFAFDLESESDVFDSVNFKRQLLFVAAKVILETL